MATESDVRIGDRVLRVRDAGDPTGSPVMYFHGTPGSRIDLAFRDDFVAAEGVRLVSFDRPGYGGSTVAPFSLSSVAADARAIAAAVGLGRFATLGFSGGGPFALATAAGNERVSRVGVASGAGPFQQVPGALESLDDNDRAAVALLGTDQRAAAERFRRGFEDLARIAHSGAGEGLLAYFDPMLSTSDRALLHDEGIGAGIVATMREGLRSSADGGGWDNVAWVGEWDFDVKEVTCPVFLFCGDEDRFSPPAHAAWLQQNLSRPELVCRSGEGHFGHIAHLAEVLAALKEDTGRP
jgi:pimeloyl-ACP methyl ester carboxylesterase